MRQLQTNVAFVALAVAAAAATPASLTAQPLNERDLRVAGLPVDADSGAVRRVLGAPMGIRPFRDDDGHVLIAWRYPDITVSFDQTGHGYSWHLSSPRFATTRGVKPGDFTSRVRSAYGRPSAEYPHNILYALRPEHGARTLGIDFFVEQGVVRSVDIGNVIPVASHRGPGDPQPD